MIYKSHKNLVGNLYIADTISRAALPEQGIDLHVNLIINSLSVSQEKLKQILQSILHDKTLCQVISYCQNGWPGYKKSVCQSIQPYYNIKDQLDVFNNIILMSNNT